MSSRVVKRITLACIFLAVAIFLFGVLGSHFVPSRLTLYTPKQQWRSVYIDGKRVLAPGCTIRSTPLIYGPHDLRIEMADGKIVWASFYHADTGVDRQVDIYVDYQPSADKVTFKQTITRYERFPGVTRTVFTGSIRPEQTSEAKPLTLDWI